MPDYLVQPDAQNTGDATTPHVCLSTLGVSNRDAGKSHT